MSNQQLSSSADYLQSTQSVLHAGQRLRSSLEAEGDTLEYAINGLERAAQQQESSSSNYQAFMFSEIETTAAPGANLRAAEDTLASVLADVQIANVLLAAGQTLGETGEKAPPAILDDALLSLQNTNRIVEASLGSPFAAGTAPGRFGFAEVQPSQATRSAGLEEALVTFRLRSDETLEAMVSEGRAAVESAVKALQKIDSAKVLQAISQLGDQLAELPKIGRLFNLGLQKLRAAFSALTRLLGSNALKAINEQVGKLWEKVKEGKYYDQALGWAFQVTETQKYVEIRLSSSQYTTQGVDRGSDELVNLQAAFKEAMGLVGGITAALALAGSLLAFTALAGPQLALALAAAYIVILAGILLIGRDYTDSETLLKRVRGVRQIADELS